MPSGSSGRRKEINKFENTLVFFFFSGGVRSLWCTSMIANREAQTEKGIKRLGSAGATRKLEGRIGDRTDSEFCARCVWVGSSYLQTPFSQRGPSPRPTAQNPRRFLPAFLFVDLGPCRSGRKRKCDWRHEFGGAVRSLVRVRYNTPHFFFRERSTTTLRPLCTAFCRAKITGAPDTHVEVQYLITALAAKRYCMLYITEPMTKRHYNAELNRTASTCCQRA